IPNVRHHDLPKALAVFAYFAGFSPVETLRAATSDCADAIGLGDIAGQISVGFDADLVLYEHNPLDELNNLEQPVRVVRQGHFIE
ncbi:MAG: amidohydrolase family protein, partial [Pseudomonadales bacterium]|nr:amidohydrolase family protein [Pseudomonadales bacterium]